MKRLITIGIALLGAVLLSAQPAVAAPVTWNFGAGVSGGSESGNGLGNSWAFDVGGEVLQVYAFANEDGLGLEAASVMRFDNGLGVCNSSDATGNRSCATRENQRQVNNSGSMQDWLLFLLPETSTLDSITVFTEGRRDRDLTYWVGNVSDGDLSGLTYSDLPGAGFATQTDQLNSSGRGALSVNLDGQQGNAVLLGALEGGSNDYFLVSSLQTTAVPLPPAAWLFLSGLAGLGLMRRKA